MNVNIEDGNSTLHIHMREIRTREEWVKQLLAEMYPDGTVVGFYLRRGQKNLSYGAVIGDAFVRPGYVRVRMLTSKRTASARHSCPDIFFTDVVWVDRRDGDKEGQS